MKLFVVCLVFLGQLFAELSPQTYENFKANSPEILRIKILHVKKNGSQIKADAEVIDVQRTNSELQKGDSIEIYYEKPIHQKYWVGPSSPMLVEKDRKYTAFLKCKDKICSLSAQGKSFQEGLYKMPRESSIKTMKPLNLEGLGKMDLRIFKPKD